MLPVKRNRITGRLPQQAQNLNSLFELRDRLAEVNTVRSEIALLA